MERKVTLKELAKLLNVSVSTVSKALNDSHEIGPETKARVKELALIHNYVPNGLAQSLQSQRTKTIGVIIPDVLAHFFAKSLHGIETAASKLGYKVIICISNESIQKEAESIRTLMNGSVDGIIMSLAKETQATQKFDHFTSATRKLPMVLFDRISDIPGCDKITINDAEVAEAATQELYNSGCRNIIYLSTIHTTSVDQERQKGYRSSMDEKGLPSRIINIDYSNFEEKLLSFLKTNPVDGIVAADELSAVSAMKTALKNGYKIPEEISVIGFTNGILGENFIPSLTTVEQNAEEQGRSAVELMVNRLEELIPEKRVHKIIETFIVRRDSTRKLLPA